MLALVLGSQTCVAGAGNAVAPVGVFGGVAGAVAGGAAGAVQGETLESEPDVAARLMTPPSRVVVAAAAAGTTTQLGGGNIFVVS